MTDEIWMHIDGFENYMISTIGNVCNKTGRILRPNNVNGYKRATLSKDRKQFYFMIHVLVGKMFIPNQDNKPFINHINGNRIDNRITNLEWVTQKENISKIVHKNYGQKSRSIIQLDEKLNFIRKWDRIIDAANELGICKGNLSTYCKQRNYEKTLGGYKWMFGSDNDFLENEIWKDVTMNGKSFSVSNMGRICTKTGHITVGSVSGNYYSFDGLRVHRLIAKAFVDDYAPNLTVHHKNGNSLDNRESNLLWCTQGENNSYIDRTIHRNNGRKIIQLDLQGNIIAYFPSIQVASNTLKISKGNIASVCLGNRRTASGYVWKYE